MFYLFVGLAILSSVAILFFIIYPVLSKVIYKSNYKKIVGSKLYKIADKNDYLLKNSMVFVCEDGTKIHINHALFGNKYIYVFFDLYLNGAVIAEEEDNSWLYYFKEGKQTKKKFIDNALTIVDDKINKLCGFTGLDKSFFIGVVCLSKNSTINEIHYSVDTHRVVMQNKIERFIKTMESKDIPNIDQKKIVATANDLAKLSKDEE